MERRDFLTGSVFAATAGLALDACTPGSNQIIPILIPEETFVPGQETWLRSTCHGCGAACGIEVRKIDGRLVKIEGLEDHPVSRGGACAKGQALPQAMYHPDRLREPMLKSADGSFEAISWDDAYQRIARTLDDQEGGLAFLSGTTTGHKKEIIRRFVAAHRGDHHLVHAPFSYEGGAGLPFDLAECNYIISFEAELLESGPSPVGFARSLAEAKQGRPGRRAKFVMIGPRLSLTAANADEWVPVRPGGSIALAAELAKALIEDGPDSARVLPGFEAFAESIAHVEPRPEARRLARELAAHSPAIAITVQGGALAHAVRQLNTLLGATEPTVAPPPFRAWPAISEPAPPETSLESAIETGYAPELLIVHGTNPLYSAPPSVGFAEWLDGIPLRIAISSFMDETAAACDLMLPESMSFERFEDALAPPFGPASVATLSTPLLVRPLYDTRSMQDILIELSRLTGNEASFPWASYEDALREAWAGLDLSWSEAIDRGGWWQRDETSGQTAPLPLEGLMTTAEESLELSLHAYPSLAFNDGRGAHLPFLQELADPVTGNRWGSVIEIGVKRASTLGIKDGDRVELSSELGSVEAAAFVTPGIHPDVVAIAAGQGHWSYGRYASGRGVNVFSLLGADPSRPVSVELRKVSA